MKLEQTFDLKNCNYKSVFTKEPLSVRRNFGGKPCEVGDDVDEEKIGVTRERQEFFDSGGRTIFAERIVTDYETHPGASVAEDREEERGPKSAWEEEHDRTLRDHIRAVEKAKKEHPTAGDSVNHHAYDAIEARARELHAQGMTLIEATAIAMSEDVEGIADAARLPKDERPDPKGPWSTEFTESVMQTSAPHAHGGGGGSRIKLQKKGTRVCKVCHLEACEHRPRSKMGRPLKEEQPRSEQVLFRATPKTSGFVARVAAQAGIPKNDVFAIMVAAICEGRLFDDVVKEWRERYPVKGVA